jgi:hypothetical protein
MLQASVSSPCSTGGEGCQNITNDKGNCRIKPGEVNEVQPCEIIVREGLIVIGPTEAVSDSSRPVYFSQDPGTPPDKCLG